MPAGEGKGNHGGIEVLWNDISYRWQFSICIYEHAYIECQLIMCR